MGIPNFRIDSLLHNVKELQNEKSCLDYRLNELRTKRSQLEKKVETANVKLVQVNDVHIKMSETLKVAEMKASKTQSQALSLEEANQVRRQKILDLNNKTDGEKEKQQEDINQFEEELVDLATRLKSTRLFYEDETLEKEIMSSEQKINDLEGKACETSQLIEQLKRDLLRIKTHISVDDDGISDETRRLVWLMVKNENHSLYKFLERLQDELNNIHDSLEESMK